MISAWPAALAIGALVGLLVLYAFARWPVLDALLDRLCAWFDRCVDMAFYWKLRWEEFLREKLS